MTKSGTKISPRHKPPSRTQSHSLSIAAARPNPEVKFYNIQRDIDGIIDEDDEEQDDQDVDEIVDSDDEFTAATGAGDMEARPLRRGPDFGFALDAEIDLESALLLDVLADEPVAGKRSLDVGMDQGFAGIDEDEDDGSGFDELTW
ncbi:hypothetical protein B0H16DRAFT_1887306 [Mycena metata]|uniref:Uncharacterized protein n=1 Tax=Mycena metata TaxID=1033252 RepID=A0AAD7IWI7_9AGAR|nr:hypothetical protein B0H16DRAFT_1887306 [Mycena metata]